MGRAAGGLTAAAWLTALVGSLVTFALLEGPAAWQPWSRPGAPAGPRLIAAGPVVAAPPSRGPAPPPAAADPTRLLIPRLGIDAAVEAVGVDAAGRMATPADVRDVGWYRPGPRPGEPGDAVVDGHVEWYSGPAVFHDLHFLRAGDTVVVLTATGRAAFTIDRLDAYRYDASVPGLFATAGPPQLSLITCTGVWDARAGVYLERLVVHATLAA